MSVALTDGETPTTVFIRPCTIHGWRPFSVSIQPAVFMRNGVTTAHTASRRNHRDLSQPVPVQQPPAPQRRTANSAAAR